MSQIRSSTLALAAIVLAVSLIASTVSRKQPQDSPKADRLASSKQLERDEPTEFPKRAELVTRLVSNSVQKPVELSPEEIERREKLLAEALQAIALTYDEINATHRELVASYSIERNRMAALKQLGQQLEVVVTDLDEVDCTLAGAKSQLAELEADLPTRRRVVMQQAMDTAMDEYDQTVAKAIMERDERNQRRARVGARSEDRSESELIASIKRRARQVSQQKVQLRIQDEERRIQSDLRSLSRDVAVLDTRQKELARLRGTIEVALRDEQRSQESTVAEIAANRQVSDTLQSKLAVLMELKTSRESAIPLEVLDRRQRHVDRIAAGERDVSSLDVKPRSLMSPRRELLMAPGYLSSPVSVQRIAFDIETQRSRL